MKKETKIPEVCIQPMPLCIVSCRDKMGKNNALVVGFTGNASLSPAMVMIGVVPDRYSHHMIKETGVFVINFPDSRFKEQFNFIGSHSGRDIDKFEKLGLKWTEGDVVKASVLSDCPLNMECTVIETLQPGTHELFIARVDKVHCNEECLDSEGNICWDTIGIK